MEWPKSGYESSIPKGKVFEGSAVRHNPIVNPLVNGFLTGTLSAPVYWLTSSPNYVNLPQVMVGKISSGAEDGLEEATEMTCTHITRYGFSNKVGLVNLSGTSYSQETSAMVDKEVREWLRKVYTHTLQLIEEHKEQVAQIAKLLLEKKVLHRDDIVRVLGPRPFQSGKPTNYDLSNQGFTAEQEEEDKKKTGDTPAGSPDPVAA